MGKHGNKIILFGIIYSVMHKTKSETLSLREDNFLYVKDFFKVFTPPDTKFYKLFNDIRIAA